MKTTQHQTKHHMQEKRNKLSLEKALQVIGPLLGTRVGVSAADGPVGAVPAQTRQPPKPSFCHACEQKTHVMTTTKLT